MIPPKGATKKGTQKYFKGRLIHPSKITPLADFDVSSIGLGTYLGNYDQETDLLYEAAVIKALESGCNLIDTAINYRCQRSERSIGRALKKAFEDKIIKREQVVVATKGGFIPFDNEPAKNIEKYIKESWVKSGLIESDDVVSNCHCLHPAFIQNQIERSLVNLELETIDIYYLHNPETQLPVIGKEVFFERLKSAFEVLEKMVAKGKIQYYGLATWKAFREVEGSVESISIQDVVSIAETVGGAGHHFRVIQLPYNLAMLEAIAVNSHVFDNKKFPILPAAASHGISVMVSASLLQGQLLNLSSAITDKIPGSLTNAQKAIQFVSSTPAVSSALVGMKQHKHVTENLKVLEESKWDIPTLQKICDLLCNY